MDLARDKITGRWHKAGGGSIWEKSRHQWRVFWSCLPFLLPGSLSLLHDLLWEELLSSTTTSLAPWTVTFDTEKEKKSLFPRVASGQLVYHPSDSRVAEKDILSCHTCLPRSLLSYCVPETFSMSSFLPVSSMTLRSYPTRAKRFF